MWSNGSSSACGALRLGSIPGLDLYKYDYIISIIMNKFENIGENQPDYDKFMTQYLELMSKMNEQNKNSFDFETYYKNLTDLFKKHGLNKIDHQAECTAAMKQMFFEQKNKMKEQVKSSESKSPNPAEFYLNKTLSEMLSDFQSYNIVDVAKELKHCEPFLNKTLSEILSDFQLFNISDMANIVNGEIDATKRLDIRTVMQVQGSTRRRVVDRVLFNRLVRLSEAPAPKKASISANIQIIDSDNLQNLRVEGFIGCQPKNIKVYEIHKNNQDKMNFCILYTAASDTEEWSIIRKLKISSEVLGVDLKFNHGIFTCVYSLKKYKLK